MTSSGHMEEDGYFTNLLNEGSNHELWEELGINPNEPLSIQNEEVTPIERPSHKRTKNFNEKEDELLVSAWLNISMDAVQGNNKNKSKYWARIYEYFHSNKDFPLNRSENSLNRRWCVIQENVNKFTGCIAQIEGRRQSGVTLEDKAKALFKAQDTEHKSFIFLHCWTLLRHQPKWIAKQKDLSAQKTTAHSGPTDSTPLIHDDNDLGSPEANVLKRPMGRKRAKEAVNQGGGHVYAEALDYFWTKRKDVDNEKERKKEERYAQAYALEQEKVELKKK